MGHCMSLGKSNESDDRCKMLETELHEWKQRANDTENKLNVQKRWAIPQYTQLTGYMRLLRQRSRNR